MGVSVKPLFYVCGCGCHISPEKILKYRGYKNGKRLGQLRCPEHRENEISQIISHVLKCDICGAIFEGAKAKFCPECRRERKLVARRAYVLDYYDRFPEKKNYYRKKKLEIITDQESNNSFCRNICGNVCVKQYFGCEYDPDKQIKREDNAAWQKAAESV